MNGHQNANAIKRHAETLGFDACGVAEARDVDPEDRLGVWLDRGFHGSMEWMRRTHGIRRDVQQKLPGAQSVVVVARNYYSERPAPAEGASRVSRYAWGRDYHRVLRKPLQELAQFIESHEPGTRCYCCIDSGPVMEKAWAVRAGIGWLGKNTLVLRRGLGSWFFIGTILTTLRLTPDEPVPDQCGGCKLCIDACPTDAIVAPRWLDANRCISYQTIENRGEVPEDIARKHGNWVFGCDICQDVCPWNRDPAVTDELDFHPREGHANPDPRALEAISEAEFLTEYAGTPIMRAKHAGMQRNASIALQNAELNAGISNS